MPRPWILQIIVVVAMLVGLGLGIAFRNRISMPPRQARKRSSLHLIFVSMCMAFVLWNSGFRQGKVSFAVGVAGIIGMIVCAMYSWLHTPAAHEELQNFAIDRHHCGRCEYDLTGNVSGVCSECGWPIPRGPLDIDSPGWALWWRKWPIDHLRNWRGTLAMLASFMLLFAALAVGSVVYFKMLAMSVLAGVMTIHMAVNTIRVMSYGRGRWD